MLFCRFQTKSKSNRFFFIISGFYLKTKREHLRMKKPMACKTAFWICLIRSLATNLFIAYWPDLLLVCNYFYGKGNWNSWKMARDETVSMKHIHKNTITDTHTAQFLHKLHHRIRNTIRFKIHKHTKWRRSFLRWLFVLRKVRAA